MVRHFALDILKIMKPTVLKSKKKDLIYTEYEGGEDDRQRNPAASSIAKEE